MNPEVPREDLPVRVSDRVRLRPVPARSASERASPEAPIARYLWVIFQGRSLIDVTVIGFLVVAVFYLVVAPPVFKTDAVLQIEERAKGLAGLSELASMLGERSPAETEISIIRSRTALGAVIDDLKLDIEANPCRFPVLGAVVARHFQGNDLAQPVLGLERFAWGGERIKVDRLQVPNDLLDEPLRVTVLEGGRYRVEEPRGPLRVNGEIGKAAWAGEAPRRVELFVSEIVARPGTQFELTKLRRTDLVARMQKELRIVENGKKSGILIITLEGLNPHRIAQIVDAIASIYVVQNVERKSAEAAKTLAFLESQLPDLKAKADAAQAALTNQQSTSGLVDLTNETRSVLERSAVVEKQFSELEMQRAELRQRFTDSHPTVVATNEKMARIRATRDAIDARMRGIPEAEFDSAHLARDAKVSAELYTLLLNKAQELRVMKSGTIGDVRVVDRAAVFGRPAWPKASIVLPIAFLVGLLAGIAAVFVRRSLSQVVEDAEEIEAETGVTVYTTIPRSQVQVAVGRRAQRDRPLLLAVSEPGDVAIESMRSLQTSIRFALVDSRNNVIALSGPTPGVGKSFVCANLAFLLATGDERVLLVDADLRRGHLHRYFGGKRYPGLSDAISGGVDLAEAIQRTANPGLDLLPTGRLPPNPALLLGSQRFEEIIRGASRAYSFVMMDTAPLLAVTDAALVGRVSGVNLMVLRAGEHTMREIMLAVKKLANNGIKLDGVTLNDVEASFGRYGKYGRYKKYEYHSEMG